MSSLGWWRGVTRGQSRRPEGGDQPSCSPASWPFAAREADPSRARRSRMLEAKPQRDFLAFGAAEHRSLRVGSNRRQEVGHLGERKDARGPRRYRQPPKGAPASSSARDAPTRSVAASGGFAGADAVDRSPNEDCHCRTGPSGLARGARLAMESSVRQKNRRKLGHGLWEPKRLQRKVRLPCPGASTSGAGQAEGGAH